MPSTDQPRRVRVVGISGAGKSTLARAAAQRLGLPYLELDEVFWMPGWRLREGEDALVALGERVDALPDGWVACGNWTSLVGDVLADADLVVWLDHRRSLVMARVVRRTLVRALTHRELWNGNRERWRNLVARSPEENIILWSWTRYAPTRERYLALADSGTVPLVRLRGRRAVRRWLNGLGGPV